MKNLFFGALCLLLITSCKDDRFIEFSKDYIEVDYQSQNLTLKTDNPISNIGIVVSETDSEPGESYSENNILYRKGDWFVVQLDKTKPTTVSVSLQENETVKDRKVVIFVHNGEVGSDSATIIQKAKPME